MKVVAIIQARMGSTRLPGKVLEDLAGQSMLARVVGRARRARTLDKVLVATTNKSDDGAIVSECGRLGVPVFRGSEDDVLDRYHGAAISANAGIIVRITSDCPLIDPEVVDRAVREHLVEGPDYTSNTLDRSYPRGLDLEVMDVGVLERAWREASEDYQRTHVTPYIYQHPEIFRLQSLTHEVDESHHRWTVDTSEDLELVRVLYRRLGDHETFTWRELLDLFREDPGLLEINRGVLQKELREG